MKRVLYLVLMIFFMPDPGLTAPKSLGKFGHWEAFCQKDKKKKVCFMVGLPIKSKGKYTKRDQPHIMITHWPSEGATSVISVHAGYPYSKDKVKAIVTRKNKQKTYVLFPKDDVAWSEHEDHALVADMVWGKTLTIRGKSCRGTLTEDTYDMTGSLKALKVISKACQVPLPKS